MEKMGNMANDGLIRPSSLTVRVRGVRTWDRRAPGQPRQTRISNRKSGIRVPRKPWEISAVQISNGIISLTNPPCARQNNAAVTGRDIKPSIVAEV